MSRDAARLERQKLNRDWDEVLERDRSQRVVEHKLISLRFEAIVIVVGVALSITHVHTHTQTKEHKYKSQRLVCV